MERPRKERPVIKKISHELSITFCYTWGNGYDLMLCKKIVFYFKKNKLYKINKLQDIRKGVIYFDKLRSWVWISSLSTSLCGQE